jgi:hypothetical protein
MRFLFLLLFTIFTFNASTQACGPEVTSDHCSTEQEVASSDCHSEDGDESESEHNGKCGCGCHIGSSAPIILSEPTCISNNSLIATKDLIKLIYLLQPKDYKNKINRPPIFLS